MEKLYSLHALWSKHIHGRDYFEFILFLTFNHAGAPDTQHLVSVSHISKKRDLGIEKLSMSGLKNGRADTSSIPIKQCFPPLRFSLTNEVIVVEHPDPQGDCTEFIST